MPLVVRAAQLGAGLYLGRYAGRAARRAAMHHLGSGAAMSEPGYHDALRVLCQDAGAELHRVLAEACESARSRSSR